MTKKFLFNSFEWFG